MEIKIEKIFKFLCCRKGCLMRDKKCFTDYMRKYRFSKELERRRARGETCAYCNKLVETLHHIDENHANNKRSNLLNVCQEHHLSIVHGCDLPELPKDSLKSSKNNLLRGLQDGIKGKRLSPKPQKVVNSQKIIDFIKENPSLRFISNIFLRHKKGHKWYITLCSKKTLRLLTSFGFETIEKVF